MTESQQGSLLLFSAGIAAPLIYVIFYFLDGACGNASSTHLANICQLLTYNDITHTILTYSSNLARNIMPLLFIPYLILTIIFNFVLLRPYFNLNKYQHRFDFLPHHNKLFKLISGIYLGLGTIFSIISIAATFVVIYMAIIGGAFWIKSSPKHPLDAQALMINNSIIVLGLCFFALAPLLAILPYKRIYKEYNNYLNTYHPKDKQHLFRTGGLIAILLICLDAFLRQLG